MIAGFFDWKCPRVLMEIGPKRSAKRDLLVLGQMLVAQQDDQMLVPSVLHPLEQLVAHRLR